MLFGPLELADGEGVRLLFGPLTLEVWREGRRLGLRTLRGEERPASREPLTVFGVPDQVFALPSAPLRVLPVLPDRALVARPERELTLPAGVDSRVWVGVPVWLRIDPLLEVAPVPAKSTWFGPSMVDGELCYASRTPLRSAPDPEMGPHRALCSVQVRNGSDQPLVISRLRLPLGRLALRRQQDRLHTDGLELSTQDHDPVLGTARIVPGEGKLLAPPRNPESAGTLRVFNAIVPRWW